MTYLTPLAALPALTRIYELSLSTSQTVSSGDVIKFDTVRATSSGGGVTNDSTTGAITLSTSYRYFIQCSIDVTRASNTDSIRVAFFDSDLDAEIGINDGGYDSTWTYHAPSSTTTQPNATLHAEYIPTSTAVSPIKVKVFDVGNNSEINTNFSMIIVETKL